jgi:hypothetical protein
MNVQRPIPLRPDPSALRRAGLTALMRTATAHVLAAERRDSPRQDPVKLAERMWPGDRDVGLLVRGAVSPTTTTSASALLTTLTQFFIEALAPVSAGALLLPRTLQLSFDGNAVISVPSFTADAASGGGFVGEGQPISARSLLAQLLQLDPSKLSTISGMTEEMVAGVAHDKCMVNVMDERAREILDQARETLHRVRDVRVEHRDHGADYWSRPTPAPAPTPQPRSPTSAEIEALVDSKLAAYHESKSMRPITREILKGLVAEIRKEIAKAHPAEEFFYLDDDGNKQDADLHGPILRAVDYPIDEKIMGPIRERNRAKWLAEQKATKMRAAHVIDLPNPLRGRRA